MNKKQMIFACVIGMMILILFLGMLRAVVVESENSLSDPDPDNKIGQIVDVPIVIMIFFPLFFDLFLLLHSGYKYLDVSTKRGSKRLYLTSVVLVLISLLCYGIPFTGVVRAAVFGELIIWLLVVVTSALSGVIFNLTATVLSYKCKKISAE